MTRYPVIAVVCCLLAFPLAGQASNEDKAKAPLTSYRATVSERDLASWLAHTSGSADDVDREEAIRSLVLTRTLAQEARRLDLDQQPEVRIELLEARGRLALAALRRHLSASIEVKEAQVDAEIEALSGKVGLPRRVRLRNLFKRFPEGATEIQKAALRDEMHALRQRVIEGADFAALAAAESDSPTRVRGGLIGNLRPGTLRPSVESVALALESGQVSEVLEEAEGLTLLYCERVLPAVVRTPDEVRKIARQRLENLAWRHEWTTMEAHLLARAQAEWKWQALHPEQGVIDPEAPLIQFLGDRLTVAEALFLLTPQATLEAMAARPRMQLLRRAEPFLRGQMAIREVVTRGLDTEAFTQETAWTVERILASKALAARVTQRLDPPSDAEADAFVRAESERFLRPEHLALRILTLPFDAADPRPAYALARRLEAQLVANKATLEALAETHSSHPSAADGGRLPAMPRNALGQRLGIEAARAIRQLQPGEHSGWVQDDERLLLWWIELLAVEPARPLEAEAARDAARRILGQRHAEALADEVTQEWLEGLDIRTHPPADVLDPR